jgi:hypothetical protein
VVRAKGGGLRVSWDGVVFVPVTAAEAQETADAFRLHFRPPAPPPPAGYSAEGGLGLYLESAVGAFRNVTLGPVGDD